MRLLLVGLGVGLTVAGAGCFSERVSGSNSAITPDVQCAIPLAVIDSGNVVVAIKNFTFTPDSVEIRPGQTVTWVNCETDGTIHTSNGDNAEWDSSDIIPGAHFSHTFPVPGATAVYTYHCVPHPSMVGKVVVQ